MKVKTKSLLFILLFTQLLNSCGNKTKVKESGRVLSSSSPSNIIFNGVDSVTSISDSTAIVNWTHITDAKSYQVFLVNSGNLTYQGSVEAPNNSFELTGLTPNSNITLGVRLVDNNLQIDKNTNFITIQTESTPNAPSAISLQSPESSTSFKATPTFLVSGVKAGDTVELFTDSNCTNKVGEANSNGTTVEITTNSLADGAYNIYSRAKGNNNSDCSSSLTNYTVSSCPTGYVGVPARAIVGVTNDFCVMQYEAKNSAGNPVSTANTTPWTGLDQATAKSECQSLNALNGVTNKYDLISNPEWMATARNIENVAENWTTGTVGDGCLNKGNIEATYPCPGSASGGDSGYNGADPEFGTGRNPLASLILDNGSVIWDFSANVLEWVDWTLGGVLSTDMIQAEKPQKAGSTGWVQVSEINNLPTTLTTIHSVLPDNPSYNQFEGMGVIYTAPSGGAATRGGAYTDGWAAGIYSLFLWHDSLYTDPVIGFRCVFRP